jgi:antirestriction protein ArdC/phage/plasmid primase-like uncharacterized protein
MLEEGVAPWQKSWKAGEYHVPCNPVSGTVYRGVNRLMLSSFDMADPRWMTFKQAQEKGYRVKAGSKARQIEFWQWTEEVDRKDDDGRIIYGPDGKPERETVKLDRPRVYFFSVFHASQLETENREPIPPYEAPPLDWNPHNKAEAILNSSGAAIFNDQRDRAYYSPMRDEIHLPYRENFSKAGDYYNTALHELGHWACSKQRLAFEGGLFGSEAYSKEELRVEIASWMICQELGLNFEPENSAAYVAHWKQFITDDPYELVRACRDAEKIKKYVLDLELGIKQEEPFVFTDMSADSAPAPEAGAVMRATEVTFLQVPYKEKNQAKVAGAKWDRDAKLWKAPVGADLSKLAKWLPDQESTPAPAVSPEAEFADVLRGFGFKLEGLPHMDGKINRVPVEGGKAGAKDGAYMAHVNGIPNGWAVNHKTGEQVKWVSNGHTLTDEQRVAMQAQAAQHQLERQKDLDKKHEEACASIFDKLAAGNCRPADADHPYLKAKGVKNHGLFQDQAGNLMVVGLDLDKSHFLNNDPQAIAAPRSAEELTLRRHIQTMQSISPEGEKRFEPGSKKSGAMFLIGDRQFRQIYFDQKQPQSLLQDLVNKPTILVAEGYATAATIHQATGLPVAVAFDAGNLRPVAEALKRKFPEAELTVCADHDHSRKINVGLEKAYEAGRAVGAAVIFPQFTDEEKAKGLTDFNDLAQSRGLFAVTKQVSSRHRRELAAQHNPDPQPAKVGLGR